MGVYQDKLNTFVINIQMRSRFDYELKAHCVDVLDIINEYVIRNTTDKVNISHRAPVGPRRW